MTKNTTQNLQVSYQQNRNQILVMALVIIVCGIAVYFNSFSGVFVLDDHRAIVENDAIHRLWPLAPIVSGMRPVLNFTLALNYALGGLDVWHFHLVNLLIHILAGLTLFGVLRRSLLTEKLKTAYQNQASWLALAIALLWLIHPVQTQSVTYIIQRAESLMGLFSLFALYSLICSNNSTRAGAWHVLSILSFALGMGSKEIAVTAPFTLLLYDRVFLTNSWNEVLRKRWRLYLGLFIILGISVGSLVLKYAASDDPTAGFSVKAITPFEYARTQPGVILHYLRLAFSPYPLVFDYFWPIANRLNEILIPGFVVAFLF